MPEQKRGFRDQFAPLLAWVGAVGSAVTLFGNLQAVIDMADWARWIVAHWTEWIHAFWNWIFAWIGVRMPRWLGPILTAYVFFPMLAFEKAALETAWYMPWVGLASLVFCFTVLLLPAFEPWAQPPPWHTDLIVRI